MVNPYRIQTQEGRFVNAGTDMPSWFSLEEARRRIKYEEGERIIQSDGVNILLEAF